MGLASKLIGFPVEKCWRYPVQTWGNKNCKWRCLHLQLAQKKFSLFSPVMWSTNTVVNVRFYWYVFIYSCSCWKKRGELAKYLTYFTCHANRRISDGRPKGFGTNLGQSHTAGITMLNQSQLRRYVMLEKPMYDISINEWRPCSFNDIYHNDKQFHAVVLHDTFFK